MALTQQGVNQASQPVTAILNAETFAVLFDGAHLMRCSVREPSTLTKWAVEDGTTRTDHRTIGQIEITIPLLLTENTRSLYEQLRAAFLDGVELIIQTRVASYPRMMIVDLPHEEAQEFGEAINLDVKFAELVTVKPEFGALPPSAVSDPKQASTVERGNQQTSEADAPTQRRASVLYGVVN